MHTGVGATMAKASGIVCFPRTRRFVSRIAEVATSTSDILDTSLFRLRREGSVDESESNFSARGSAFSPSVSPVLFLSPTSSPSYTYSNPPLSRPALSNPNKHVCGPPGRTRHSPVTVLKQISGPKKTLDRKTWAEKFAP